MGAIHLGSILKLRDTPNFVITMEQVKSTHNMRHEKLRKRGELKFFILKTSRLYHSLVLWAALISVVGSTH